jgi:hypothetical protein
VVFEGAAVGPFDDDGAEFIPDRDPLLIIEDLPTGIGCGGILGKVFELLAEALMFPMKESGSIDGASDRLTRTAPRRGGMPRLWRWWRKW